MKRTARFLAAPAIAAIILAGCGTGEQEAASPTESSEESTTADESDAWPTVEDEDGNVVENPEDQPMDDGGDDTSYDGAVTDEAGNVTAIEFGDGEQIEFDMEAAMGEKPLAPGVRVYGISENGGDFIITTAIEPVDDLEAYRELAGGEPVTYLSADIDNRDGTENINMYQVAIYDAAGNEYVYTSADETADLWRDAIDSNGGSTDEYNQGVDLTNKYLNQGASPHQRSTMILTGPELPDEFTAVVAMPRGAFEVTPTIPIKD